MQPADSRSAMTVAAAADNIGATLPSAAPALPGPVSRRRGSTLEAAIYDAVLAQLSAVGFSAMTMEGVAACARTGKAALYRRWPSKEDLVADTLDNSLPPCTPPPDTGSVRGDIAQVFRWMADTMASPAGCAMQTLFGQLDRTHDFVKTVNDRVLAPRAAMMLDILRRGVERGDVRPDAVLPVIAEAGPALLVHRLLTTGPPLDAAFIEAVLDEVVMPLIRPTPASAIGRKGGTAAE